MYDCKTLYGLIQDGLFTSWNYRFVFVPWLHDLQLLSLSFSSLHPSFLWRTDTIVFAKLTKPSLSSKPSSNVFEINKPRPRGLDFTVYKTVGILLVKVYERAGNFVILGHKKALKAKPMHFIKKSRKAF